MVKSGPPDTWLAAQPPELRGDCQRLLLERLGWTLTDWVTQRHRPLPAEQLAQLSDDAARLLAGEPLAYLLGSAAFRGLTLEVTPAVLIPRPETEELIDHLLPRCRRLLRDNPTDILRIIELGTGSGAIILALADELRAGGLLPRTELLATDRSASALTVARRNGTTLALPVHWLQADWLTGLRGPFDLIVSNPPYLCDNDRHLPSLQHEPHTALVAGRTGLEDLTQLIAQAPGCLNIGGELWLEHGYDQGTAVAQLLKEQAFTAVECHTDSYGNDRFSSAQWRGPRS